ncbi:MAG: PQQ-binding-like beta-propeller repeat protein [Myxococcales bacterium]|nr:PQQ-binding-like beta-propeller repeat protein [Myxococcales bacterium]
MSKRAMSNDPSAPNGWWMHHGDAAHTGLATDSSIDSSNVRNLALRHEVLLGGPILSTPAVVDGFVYVGIANNLAVAKQNGGGFFKVCCKSGEVVARYSWAIEADERDTHGFCGMGCTPAVRDGKVVFAAFNGKVYCLSADDLSEQWVVDLRNADPKHGQPVTNVLGVDQGYPPAAGWSSPVVANGRVWLGIGEGENPFMSSFVVCLDLQSGDVKWIYCTNKFEAHRDNAVNELPISAVRDIPGAPFTVFHGKPTTMGCSVWGSIAYSHEFDRIYCPTGNPVPDGALPTVPYSNGVLALDASSGEFRGFRQFPAESSYRSSDIDVDVGGSPTIFRDKGGRLLLSLGCKNGAFMTMCAESLEVIDWTQLLPRYNDGGQIPTVDVHPPAWVDPNAINPTITNRESNETQGENYCGTYSTAAFHPELQRLFMGLGGNNYHPSAPGIDSASTPFIRALHVDGLADAWPLDDGDPRRYVHGRPPLYTLEKESGLALPAVANDVVFMTTSRLALYAFSVHDGRLLWQDLLGGMETGGMNGGYGYCLGPAICGDWVVTGSLMFGASGGSLRIYTLDRECP